MKANTAPERIWINLTTDLPKLCGHIDKDSVRYTRTDYAEKEFLIKVKSFLSEIHRVCDITDENGYRIGLRELQARFEKYMKGE